MIEFCNYKMAFLSIKINLIMHSSALSEMQNDIKLHIPPDGSGFYVIAQKVATNTANIWKYLYSNPGSEDCQEILSVVVLPFGQIMINIGQFYFTGVDTTFNNLHFYKVVYGSTATDWTKKMVCTMSTWSIARGETLLDDSKTKLISLFTYGVGSSGTNRYGYFVKFSVSDGSVTGGRYKTNISCSDIQGSLLYGNYLISTISCSPDSYLLLLNKLNGEFSTIKYPGTAFGWAADYNGR